VGTPQQAGRRDRLQACRRCGSGAAIEVRQILLARGRVPGRWTAPARGIYDDDRHRAGRPQPCRRAQPQRRHRLRTPVARSLGGSALHACWDKSSIPPGHLVDIDQRELAAERPASTKHALAGERGSILADRATSLTYRLVRAWFGEVTDRPLAEATHVHNLSTFREDRPLDHAAWTGQIRLNHRLPKMPRIGCGIHAGVLSNQYAE